MVFLTLSELRMAPASSQYGKHIMNAHSADVRTFYSSLGDLKTQSQDTCKFLVSQLQQISYRILHHQFFLCQHIIISNDTILMILKDLWKNLF